MQITSLLAYQEVLENLGERQLQVLKALKEIQPANNLMIARHIRMPVNCVTGRVFELRQKGLVIQDSKQNCPITKKLSIFWKTKLM